MRAKIFFITLAVAGLGRPVAAHMRPFGVYSGYFTDPDGHLFEVARDSGR